MASSDCWETYWGDESQHDWWKRPAPEVLEFIASQSPAPRPDALDLGCGLGRHAIALAQAGFCVTATDASATAIAHLDGWARELDLSIRAQVCDVLDDRLPPGTFDIVLSYNVIYHGYRQQFAQAIERAWTLLKPAGLFFFTCPSRQDGKYGHGEQVAPHTFLCEKSITPGDMHYFADQADLDDLLTNFGLLSRIKDEGYWDNQGVQQFYSNWHILAEKT
jgi:tellurite methyltransferase